jgi:hypothetical protein
MSLPAVSIFEPSNGRRFNKLLTIDYICPHKQKLAQMVEKSDKRASFFAPNATSLCGFIFILNFVLEL